MGQGGTEKAADSRRRLEWEGITLASMYIGYAAFMVLRNTLIAASPAMLADPGLGLDKAKYGKLMSLHTVGAITGKAVTGVGADRIGGRLMFLIALTFTAGANIGFGLVSGLTLFMLLNFLGQFFKAGGWPAMTKIIGAWYAPSKYGRVWGIISTASRAGTIFAGLVLGYLLLTFSWRTVFLLSGVGALLLVAVCAVMMKDRPEQVGLPPAPSAEEKTAGVSEEPEPHPLDGTTLAQACKVFAFSGRVWFICLSLVFLTAMMDFMIFIPVFMKETLHLAAGQASMASSAFPFGAFVSLLASGFVYDRLSKAQLRWALGALLLVSLLCIVALRALPLLSLSATAQLIAAMAAIFVFGATISPAYYLPMSIFSISFGGSHSGFLVALIDVFGYAGAFLWTYFGGILAQTYGWDMYLTVLIGVSAMALVTTNAFLHLDYHASSDETRTPPQV